MEEDPKGKGKGVAEGAPQNEGMEEDDDDSSSDEENDNEEVSFPPTIT